MLWGHHCQTWQNHSLLLCCHPHIRLLPVACVAVSSAFPKQLTVVCCWTCCIGHEATIASMARITLSSLFVSLAAVTFWSSDVLYLAYRWCVVALRSRVCSLLTQFTGRNTIFTFLKHIASGVLDWQGTYPQWAALFCLMIQSWHHIDEEDEWNCLPSCMH